MFSDSDCDSEGKAVDGADAIKVEGITGRKGDDWSTPLQAPSVLLSLSLSLWMLLLLWLLLSITSRALVVFPLTPGDGINHAL